MNFEAFFVPVAVAAVTGLGTWVFKLGSRVTVQETKYEGLRELTESRFDDVERRLERIERLLNGRLRHD